MLMSLNPNSIGFIRLKQFFESHLRSVELFSNQLAIVANSAAAIAKGIGDSIYDQKVRRNPTNDKGNY